LNKRKGQIEAETGISWDNSNLSFYCKYCKLHIKLTNIPKHLELEYHIQNIKFEEDESGIRIRHDMESHIEEPLEPQEDFANEKTEQKSSIWHLIDSLLPDGIYRNADSSPYCCPCCNFIITNRTMDVEQALQKVQKHLSSPRHINNKAHVEKDVVWNKYWGRYICIFCIIIMPDILSAKSHIKGKRHNKKLQQYRNLEISGDISDAWIYRVWEQIYKNNPGFISIQVSVSQHKSLPDGFSWDESLSVYFCEYCKLGFKEKYIIYLHCALPSHTNKRDEQINEQTGICWDKSKCMLRCKYCTLNLGLCSISAHLQLQSHVTYKQTKTTEAKIQHSNEAKSKRRKLEVSNEASENKKICTIVSNQDERNADDNPISHLDTSRELNWDEAKQLFYCRYCKHNVESSSKEEHLKLQYHRIAKYVYIEMFG